MHKSIEESNQENIDTLTMMLESVASDKIRTRKAGVPTAEEIKPQEQSDDEKTNTGKKDFGKSLKNWNDKATGKVKDGAPIDEEEEHGDEQVKKQIMKMTKRGDSIDEIIDALAGKVGYDVLGVAMVELRAKGLISYDS